MMVLAAKFAALMACSMDLPCTICDRKPPTNASPAPFVIHEFFRRQLDDRVSCHLQEHVQESACRHMETEAVAPMARGLVQLVRLGKICDTPHTQTWNLDLRTDCMPCLPRQCSNSVEPHRSLGMTAVYRGSFNTCVC